MAGSIHNALAFLLLLGLSACANQSGFDSSKTLVPSSTQLARTTVPAGTVQPIVSTRTVQVKEDMIDNPFSPKPGDEKLVRGPVFVDSLSHEVMPAGVARIALSGSLPTPCNQLRLEVRIPPDSNQIKIEAYSLTNPEEMCIQVIVDFDAEAALHDLPAGDYPVLLNGEEMSVISIPGE